MGGGGGWWLVAGGRESAGVTYAGAAAGAACRMVWGVSLPECLPELNCFQLFTGGA
jgi:hypothetical protein